MPSREDIQRLILYYNRRLQLLREQQAMYGLSTPPAIVLEIEDIETKLADLRTTLASLAENFEPPHQAKVMTDYEIDHELTKAGLNESSRSQPQRAIEFSNIRDSSINIGGDVIGQDKVGGDKVGRDKITNIYIQMESAQLSSQTETIRMSFEPETLLIPAGPFLMGSHPGENVPDYETPLHEINLPAFKISKYPITNLQYAAFIQQTGQVIAPEAGWIGQNPPSDKLNHPVIGVTWHNALAYCRWLSQQTDKTYKLPSEAQWEKAARGADGRIFPWGNEWQPDRCNHGTNQVIQVDAYPPQTIYGGYDMVGNVREWTCSLWGETRQNPNPEYQYPWSEDEHLLYVNTYRHLHRVYRGGAATDDISQLRCSARNGYVPDKSGPRDKRHGFRVVLLEM